MFKTLRTVVLAMLCPFFNANAQQISPLKIGDTIPESVWNMPLKVINHPKGKKTIKLKDYRGKKLIILDFWSTWCSPCVASINKLAPIYHRNSAELMFLPIAAHDRVEEAKAFMKKKKWNIPSVFDGDQTLYTKVFPPPYGKGIPYVVWIKDNKVFAIPDVAYVTEENILKTIKGEQIDLKMVRTDLKPLDLAAPLFVNGNGKTGTYFINAPYSLIARHLPGYSMGGKTSFIKKGDTSILVSMNRTLPNLCFDAYQQFLFPGLDVKNGIVWKISDSLKMRLFNSPKHDITHELAHELLRDKWISNNTYGYNLRYPELLTERQALHFMQQDIARFFGIYMGLKFKIADSVKHRYAVLRLAGTKQQTLELLNAKNNQGVDKSRQQYTQVNFTQSFLWMIRNALPELTIKKVLDSTGIQPDLRVNYELPKDILGKPELLIQELRHYGLLLEIKERYVPVLVVTEEKVVPKSKMIIQ